MEQTLRRLTADRQDCPSGRTWVWLLLGCVSTACVRFGYESLGEASNSLEGQAGSAGTPSAAGGSTSLQDIENSPSGDAGATGDVGEAGLGGAGGAAGSASAGTDVGGAGLGGAGGEAGAMSDVSDCGLVPFGAPEQLGGFGFAGPLWGPALLADGLTLYLAIDVGLDENLYVATRPDRGTQFSAALALTNLNSARLDGTPFITSDGLSLYFASTRLGGAGDRDLMVATRPDLGSPFESPSFVSELNTASREHNPTLTADELTIVFGSDRPGGSGAEDLWMAQRASRNDPFSPPVNLSTLNTASSDGGPTLSTDGLRLYFATNAPNPSGDRHLWTATRPDRGSPFSAPEPVSELDSAGFEQDPELSADETEILFASNRSGSIALWRATRQCP